MPFDPVPLKLTGEQFSRELMIRFLIKRTKANRFILEHMPTTILTKFYEAFRGKHIP